MELVRVFRSLDLPLSLHCPLDGPDAMPAHAVRRVS